ncbi:MAG: glycosyltransferase family 2 protein [Clostridia bacterium]|nr:glycosyltransferase family 2 protein [Clostridia bacterium]
MKNENLVSIVLPIYNVEKYLPKCIESVLGQTYKNIEIICVNDGSPDGSEKIVSDYMKKDSRITLINQKNQGLSGARNTGIENANGEYIIFLDSDDWLDTETVEAAVNEAQKEDAQLVMWSYVREFPDVSVPKNVFEEDRIVFDGDGVRNRLHRRMAGLTGKELADPGNADSAVTAWGKMYKTECIKNCRFVDTKIIGTEDALFSLMALCYVDRAVYINRCFNHYRKDNDTSLTRKYKPQLFSQWQELYNRMSQVIKENNLPFEEALNNRIALSIIGLGLNELINTTSHKEKIKKLKDIITCERYKKAYSDLTTEYFPIHWKLFFTLCKTGNATGVYILLKCIDKIISK